MVSKEQVEELMIRYFPICPLCGANKGYEVLGVLKDYVQCRSCGAKWWSADFVSGEEIKEMKLWEPAKDGKGKDFLKQKRPIHFWRSMQNYHPIEAPKHFLSEMTEQQLQDLVKKGMEEVNTWDTGSTLYGKFGALLDSSTFAERTMVRLLKAILEQNKILIIQNELIRRALAQSKAIVQEPR